MLEQRQQERTCAVTGRTSAWLKLVQGGQRPHAAAASAGQSAALEQLNSRNSVGSLGSVQPDAEAQPMVDFVSTNEPSAERLPTNGGGGGGGGPGGSCANGFGSSSTCTIPIFISCEYSL